MIKQKKWIFVATIFAIFLVSVIAPQLQNASGYISKATGYVKDQQTSLGVGGVRVTVYGRYELNGRLTSFSRYGYTNSNGYYSISLPTNTVYYNRIITSKTGWSSYDGPKISVIYINYVGPTASATIKGYVSAVSHSYDGLPDAIVKVYDSNDNYLGWSDQTDSNGYFEITTSSFTGVKEVKLKVSKEITNGFYSSTLNLLDTDNNVDILTIEPLHSYTRYFDIQDHDDYDFSVAYTLRCDIGDPLHFIFVADYTISPNSFSNEVNCIFESWSCTILNGVPSSLSKYHFRFEAFTSPITSEENSIPNSTFEGYFYYENDIWTTLSGTAGYSNMQYIYLKDTTGELDPTWEFVYYDSLHGFYIPTPEVPYPQYMILQW